MGGIVGQFKEHFPDASFLVFNFLEGESQSQLSYILSEYDITIVDYPQQYKGCPLLRTEVIHHFLRSVESWLSLGPQNLILMHCERGGWPVLAFMLAALLLYRKQFSGEQKTLEMIYRQAPHELLQLLQPLNPIPSQLRYLKYSRRNVASEWPPLESALTLDCVILRFIPNFDGEGGCRPIFRIYGHDFSYPTSIDLCSTPRNSTPRKGKAVRAYKQMSTPTPRSDVTGSSVNSRRTDIAWNHCMQVVENNTNDLRCIYCEKVVKGGVNRIKQHLVGNSTNVTSCKCCPKEVKDEIKQFMEGKKAKKQTTNMEFDNEIEIMRVEEEEEEVQEVEGGKRKKSNVSRGPLDVFFSPKPAVLGKGKRQPTIDENTPAKKELRERACVAIARWMYDAGIAFNAVNYDSFGEMIRAIGNYGREMKPPSYHEVRVRLLQQEVDLTKYLFQRHEEDWDRLGCSLMCDGWTDRKGQTLINFLVNGPKGSVFIKSVDASDASKTGYMLAELLEKEIRAIGENRVVQVVTDNAANNVAAGKLLEATFPHLYWTPCATHCLDLILEDIFKLYTFKETFRKAVELTGFIYGSSGVLNMLREFTKNRELLRPGATRFATSFLTLGRIHQQKRNLRTMFTSEKWVNSKWAKEMKGKKCERTVLSTTFWNEVTHALKVSGPLVKVLRLVDNERKPSMGYIYEAMDKAKETISRDLKNEKKYKKIEDIIDRRWNDQLHRPLHAAGYFLNPELFYPNKDQIISDEEVNDGLLKCIEKMVSDQKTRQAMIQQLEKYKEAAGMFGMEMARTSRTTTSPASWWSTFGSCAPQLQKFAMKVLSLTCSASGCERNWSIFEHLHSKKRNRLAQQKLDQLVYVKYNRALLRRYTIDDTTTPIDLSNIDESNEWLLSELEGEADFDDYVFPDNDLTWNDVSRASGVNEARYESRSRSQAPRSNPNHTGGSTSRPSVGLHLIDEDEQEHEVEANKSDDDDDDDELGPLESDSE